MSDEKMVKRYSIDDKFVLVEDKNGSFVKWGDYQNLLSAHQSMQCKMTIEVVKGGSYCLVIEWEPNPLDDGTEWAKHCKFIGGWFKKKWADVLIVAK